MLCARARESQFGGVLTSCSPSPPIDNAAKVYLLPLLSRKACVDKGHGGLRHALQLFNKFDCIDMELLEAASVLIGRVEVVSKG